MHSAYTPRGSGPLGLCIPQVGILLNSPSITVTVSLLFPPLSNISFLLSRTMASLSVGDIILCSQIVYRLLTAATIGRKSALRDLRELESVLLGLSCSLDHLQNVTAAILSREANPNPNSVDIQQSFGVMVHSCRKALEDLEQANAKYRETVKEPSSTQTLGSTGPSRLVKIKSQWRSFMWDFRGESLTRYRQKLETHTAAINLMLNTFMW